MEPFYLSDIRAVTSNKTIERIISPMAAQLCHLMIAAEWDGVNNEHLADLEKAAEELAKATEELAYVARRVAHESNDELLAGEMLLAAESLLASGRSILLVAQKLHIQPDIQRHQEELIDSAKRVLMETVKILQLEDDAVVTRIIQAAHWLRDCLTALELAGDIPALLVAFRDFSESLLLLNNLTERRIQELRDSPPQKYLAQTLQILRKCVPMLHAAKHGHLKHPQDQQVSGSKTYIFRLMDSTIKELISLLTTTTRNKELLERNGLFSQHLSQLLGLLSNPNPAHLAEGEFSLCVETVIFHCMLLANSSRPGIKLQLIKHCHHLLMLKKSISNHGSIMEELPAQSQLECSLEEKCHAMSVEVEILDQTMLTAVLCQILDTFTDINEPLKRLMAAALEPTTVQYSPAGEDGFLRKLQPLITAFFSHAHQMLKVANFVLARCTNLKIFKEIEDCVDCLNRLLATVPLLLTEMSKDPNKINIEEPLQTFYRRWAWTTESLLACVDETINLPRFLDLSIQEMADHRQCCEQELESQNSGRFSWHATHMTSRAARVIQVTNRFLDKVRDPIFKNGLLVLVKQLEISILEVRTATNHCLGGISCLQTRNAFSKRVKHLMDSTRNVREGLDESNHPDILSPLREQIRSLDIPKELCCFSAQDHTELRPPDVIKQSTPDNTELVEEFLSEQLPSATSPLAMLPRAGNLHPGRVDLHPVVNELITAAKKHDITAVNTACFGLLELSNCCVGAAQEALPIVKSPLLEKLTHYRKIVLLTPSVISLAREIGPNPVSRADRLLPTAVLLSEKICETNQCLVAVAGSWYSLVQRLFCTVAPADFLKSKQTLDEIMQTLATVVQLAADVAHTDCKEERTIVPKIQERFVRVQAKFTHAQTNTKHLLEKALSSHQDHLEGICLLWSVSIQVLLSAVDQLIGRDVLFLGELRNTMKHKLRLREVLAAVSESSLRIQEAARLSYLACAEHSVQRDILALREEIKVLTEALLQVVDVLSVSPVPATNLSVRAELLQRELAVRVQALLLLLTSTNREYTRVTQDILILAWPPVRAQGGDRMMVKQAGQIMANVQLVKTIIEDALENTAHLKMRESLLSLTDHLLLLTAELLGRAGEQLQSQQDEELVQLDYIAWEWSAKAHYVVTQLQSVKDIDKATLELIKQCLQNSESRAVANQCHGKAELSPAKIPSTKHQNLTHQADSANAWPTVSESGGLTARDAFEIMLLIDSPNDSKSTSSEQGKGATLAALPEDAGQWQDDSNKMSQVAKEMAIGMSHMARFLKRKGPITTKEQLIACATQMASNGQMFVRFGHLIAKNCLDERCATELLCVTEQIQTISNQLRIISRVCESQTLTQKKQRQLPFVFSGRKSCCGTESKKL
ncbi:vinculin-like isoform 2-T2 [Pangshura tecta]